MGALTNEQISVVGGGVAGLAAARALALRGANVVLYEQADEIAEVGAGLQISPNGRVVLTALGLDITPVSRSARAVVLTDGLTARPVLTMDLAQAAGPYAFLHRARLIEVLHEGAKGAGVEIRLGSRHEAGAGLTVAADGVHSTHRAALNGDGAAQFSGQVAWRALILDDGEDDAARVFMGPGRHLVTYRLGAGLRNIVAVEERSEWAAEGWHETGDPAGLRAAFATFSGPVPGWLEAVQTVHLWGLFLHPVARRWHNDQTVLIGDAAHPTLPFLAQGANLALEDAWVLAECLDQACDATGLAAFQSRRRDRAIKIVAAAAANARNYHLRPPIRGLAHTALRLASRLRPDAPMRRFDWLYSYDATTQ
ncbi:MAG: FAD-dependent oxidoreductase [Pseudomonadota bacterium]